MERGSSPQLRKSCERNSSPDTTTDIANTVEETVCKDNRRSSSNENSQSRIIEKVSNSNSEGKDTFFAQGTVKAPPFLIFSDTCRKPYDKYYNTLQTPGPSSAIQPHGSVKKNEYTKASNLDTTKGKPSIDADRVNELDCFGNQNHFYHFPCTRTFTNHLLKPHSDIFKRSQKDNKEPVAGPSNKGKKTKLTVTNSDDSAFDEAKSITNIILENSLNQVDSNQDIKFIVDHLSVQKEESEVKKIESIVSVCKNSAADRNETAINPTSSSATHKEQECTNIEKNITSVSFDDSLVNQNENANICEQEEVARSSREALFDPNSQVDLLDDFELITPLIQEFIPVEESASNARHNILLIGVNMNINEDDGPRDDVNINQEDESTQDSDDDGFPDWLLQIMLGGHTENEDEESHDEPHFYCQGDGLGVHPSVIAVDVDDEDAGTTDSSSSNSTQEFAEAESHNDASIVDAVSTETEENMDSPTSEETQHPDEDVWGAPSQDEYFDTFED